MLETADSTLILTNGSTFEVRHWLGAGEVGRIYAAHPTDLVEMAGHSTAKLETEAETLIIRILGLHLGDIADNPSIEFFAVTVADDVPLSRMPLG